MPLYAYHCYGDLRSGQSRDLASISQWGIFNCFLFRYLLSDQCNSFKTMLYQVIRDSEGAVFLW